MVSKIPSELQNPEFQIPRLGFSVVYNSQTKRLNYFGGMDPIKKEFHNDLWELDQDGWKKIPINGNLPAERAFMGMVFDRRTNNLLLHGGLGSLGNIFGDTWTFDGVNWEIIDSSLSAYPRLGFSLTNNLKNETVVLFGGATPQGRYNIALNDTWIWDGIDWVQQFPATSPPPRSSGNMVFSPIENCVILIGGESERGGYDDAWLWNGTSWLERSSLSLKHVALESRAIIFDTNKNSLLLVGKKAVDQDIDAWILDGEKWRDKLLNINSHSNHGFTYNQLIYHPDWQTSILFSTLQERKIGENNTVLEGVNIWSEVVIID